MIYDDDDDDDDDYYYDTATKWYSLVSKWYITSTSILELVQFRK